VRQALREIARVSRRVMISDMHPAAMGAGWTRSFETTCRKYRIAHYRYALAEIEEAAYAAGLRPECNMEASFGEPELRIFERAGKRDRFEGASKIPAIFVKTWV
jgi:hypothetical protein